MNGTEIERQDAHVTPPRAGTTPGKHVTCIATSTTSATHDMQAFTELYGRFLDIKADGGKIYVAFDDDSTGSISPATPGGATGIASGTTEAVGWPIADGETLPVVLDPLVDKYMHVVAATGTPQLRIRGSSPKGGQGG